jgi:myo-inositol-1(or 4)-monophosphatase
MNINSLLNKIVSQIELNLNEILSRRYDFTIKVDGSPVTAADFYVEKFLHEFLKNTIPDLKFIGEESFDSNKEFDTKGYVAILDPIDGTENFCSGLKEWGISFGIWQNGLHLGSLLMMPELGESLMTGEKLANLHSRITGFSSSFNNEIATGIRDAQEYRVTGCAVYNLFNVVRGSFCRFVNPKGAYVWDLLPGVMLALEHGCEVLIDEKPYYGEFLDPNRKYRVDIRHRYDLHSGEGAKC